MGQFDYNSVDQNQARLKEVSLDGVSGIQTMLDNMNKSSDVILPAITTTQVDGANVITPVYDTLPNTSITPITQSSNILNNGFKRIENKANGLTFKQIDLIEVTLLSAIVILLAIAIFK